MRITKFFIYFSLLLLIACGPGAPEERFKEETPEEKEEKLVDLNILRLEQDLFKCNAQNINPQIDSLRKKYGDFFDLYIMGIGRISRPDDPTLDQKILYYINDGDIKNIYADINAMYPNLNELKGQLQKAFTRYKHFFPEKKIPRIITYLSGFNEALALTENDLGIGLDRYLGRNYKYYTAMPERFPQYKLISACKEYIATDALYGWCVTEFTDSSNTMLGTMVFQGKVLFLLDALLPGVPDSIKLRYTAKQTEWCKANEGMIWSFFVDKKLLYLTDGKAKQKFTGEAPFTPGMPQESPGRVGNWLGWQIVKAYMGKNSTLSIPDLFKENDSQKILSASGYRPAKTS